MAVETAITTDFVAVMGEVTSKASFEVGDQDALVRKVIREIGYSDPAMLFDADSCKITLKIHAAEPGHQPRGDRNPREGAGRRRPGADVRICIKRD